MVLNIDYEHADTYLDLSYEDSVAIADWLASIFPDGYESPTDDEIVACIYNSIALSDSFEYQHDVTDFWESMEQFCNPNRGL